MERYRYRQRVVGKQRERYIYKYIYLYIYISSFSDALKKSIETIYSIYAYKLNIIMNTINKIYNNNTKYPKLDNKLL